MKTLDEVITELEDEGVFPDALHYLKEYKIKRERIMAKAQDCEDTEKRLQDEIARYQEAVKNCELAENKYIKSKITYDEKLSDYISLRDAWAMEQENPPLTWDEMKAMKGKPVWVEEYDPIDEKTGWQTASWKLIEYINDEYFDVRDSDGEQYCFYKSENDWQAYRKERE